MTKTNKNMQIIQDKREWEFLTHNGKIQRFHCNYSICIEEGIVRSIQNFFGYMVEENSEVFEFYSNKYNIS